MHFSHLLDSGWQWEVREGSHLGQLGRALALDQLGSLALDLGVFMAAPDVQLRLEGLGQGGVHVLHRGRHLCPAKTSRTSGQPSSERLSKAAKAKGKRRRKKRPHNFLFSFFFVFWPANNGRSRWPGQPLLGTFRLGYRCVQS